MRALAQATLPTTAAQCRSAVQLHNALMMDREWRYEQDSCAQAEDMRLARDFNNQMRRAAFWERRR